MRTYRAGSLTLTTGSKTLVGVDTAFLSNVEIGAVIICENSQCFEVVAVPDDTHLTVDVAAKNTGSFQYCAVRFATAVNFRDLSIKIEQFLGDRQINLNEFQAWQTGTKDGGTNGDGKYPITDRYGVVGLYSCPEKLSFGYDEAENQAEAAAASAAAALASQTAAAASEDAAEAFRIDAGESSSSAAAAAGAAAGSKVDAETAAAAALASKNAAATSETNAAGSATAANTSKVNAATSETNAAASAAAALASKNAAATSETNANTSKNAAATSATNAAASETAANTSKNAAAASATAAANSATAADGSKTAAAASATAADASKTAAAGSATTATTAANTATAAAVNLGLAGIDPAPGGAWHFDTGLEGWTSTNATVTAGTSTAVMVGTALDSYLVSPVISVNGALYPTIKAKVTRRGGTAADWDGTVYYSTQGGHATSGSYRRTIANPNLAIGQSAVLEWDMSNLTAGGNDWITSTIVRLRIDIGGTQTDSAFDVDWITVCRAGPSAGFTPKLTAIAAATMAANQMMLFTGANSVSPVNVTPYMQGLFGTPTDTSTFRTAVSAERIPNMALADGTTDWNNLPTTGGWHTDLLGPNNANGPAAGQYYYPLTLRFAGANGWTQIAFPYGVTGSNTIYWRCYYGGWLSWRRVVHNDNFSAFGLDLVTKADAAAVRTYINADNRPVQADVDTTTSWNDIVDAGWYPKLIGGGAPNGPGPNYYHAYNISYAWNGSITQFAYPYASSGPDVIWWRTRFGGTWQAWRYTMTSAQFSTFGSALVAMTSLTTVQAHLGLVPTSSNVDSTTGRLMTVGYGGIGGVCVSAGASAGNPTGRALNDPKPGGLYSYYSDTIGPWSSVAVNMLEAKWAYDGTWGSQLGMGISNSELLYRSVRNTSEAGQTRPWTRLLSGVNVLGTVAANFDASVSNGIMEYTENANGYYFKFYNGLLICVTSFANYTASTSVQKTWAHAFLSGSIPVVCCSVTPNIAWDTNYAYYGTATVGTFYSTSTYNNTVYMAAIGRWR